MGCETVAVLVFFSTFIGGAQESPYEELRAISAHKGGVHAVAISSDGSLVASGGVDEHAADVKLWDPATGTAKGTLQGHFMNVRAVAFSPNGKRLASGGYDRVVRIWDVADRKERFALEGHKDELRALAFSPDGAVLASGSKDGIVKLWNPSDGKEIRTLGRFGDADAVLSLAFHPNGTLLVSGHNDGKIKLWAVATGKEIRSDMSLKDTPIFGKVAEVEQRIAEVKKGAAEAEEKANRKAKDRRAQGDPEAEVRAELDRECRAIRAETEVAVEKLEKEKQVWKQFNADAGGLLRGADGKMGWRFAPPGVTGLVFRPDGKRLASAGKDGSLTLWDLDAPDKPTARIPAHSGMVTALAYRPDGKLIATAGMDFTVKIWDSESGKELGVLKGHEHYVKAVAFGPDGRWIASASTDGTVRIWGGK